MRRIGRLASGDSSDPGDWPPENALRDLGWIEGRNLRVERRSGPLDALPRLAQELVRANVEVIITQGTPETLAAMRATTKIPIVFSVGDAIAVGIVKSLARPEGNATGLSFAGLEIEAKQLAVLKELLPSIERLGVLEPAAHPYFLTTRDRFQRLCRSLGLEVILVEIRAANEIDAAVTHLARRGAQAVVLRGSSFIQDNAPAITSAALKYAMPTMAEQAELVRDAGALISYAGVLPEIEGRRASYVDRILRGKKPADLPVEQLTQFQLVINLNTAAALRITVPPGLLSRADDVIR